VYSGIAVGSIGNINDKLFKTSPPTSNYYNNYDYCYNNNNNNYYYN